MEKFCGFIFSKLNLIGTKSEGPIYFLQQFDYLEVSIIKKSQPWMEDKNIQSFLGKKATVTGDLNDKGIAYSEIELFDPSKLPSVEDSLKIKLITIPDQINLDQITSSNKSEINFTISVEWPFRSIWRGLCPTTQIYDFFIIEENNIIAKWSDGKAFNKCLTPVVIPGGNPRLYKEKVSVDTSKITNSQKIIARAVFIASNQEIEKSI